MPKKKDKLGIPKTPREAFEEAHRLYENAKDILRYYRGGIGVDMIKEGLKHAKVIIDTLSKVKSFDGR